MFGCSLWLLKSALQCYSCEHGTTYNLIILLIQIQKWLSRAIIGLFNTFFKCNTYSNVSYSLITDLQRNRVNIYSRIIQWTFLYSCTICVMLWWLRLGDKLANEYKLLQYAKGFPAVNTECATDVNCSAVFLQTLLHPKEKTPRS